MQIVASMSTDNYGWVITPKKEEPNRNASNLVLSFVVECVVYTTPCAIIALATFMKPAILAPFT